MLPDPKPSCVLLLAGPGVHLTSGDFASYSVVRESALRTRVFFTVKLCGCR